MFSGLYESLIGDFKTVFKKFIYFLGVKKGLTSLLLLLQYTCLFSQSFSGHPPGLQWQKLVSGEVNIFFPKGLEQVADRVYHQIHRLHLSDTALGTARIKFNLVLQNQTIWSNGYAGIGPFMSEYFLTPPLNSYVIGSGDWPTMLAIHEYRHIQQFMNSRKGITRFLYTLMGEEAWAAASGLALPDWFLEGDAVVAETVYSNSGRGRMPAFRTEFRALAKENTYWPYIKARNGSFKNLVPNEYATGYPMVKYLNNHFGEDAWGRILEDAVKYKGFFYSFSKALRRHSGLSPARLYTLSLEELKNDQTSVPQETIPYDLATGKNTIENHVSPNPLPDGNMIYLHTGYNRLPFFKKVYPDGRQEKLTSQGITTDEDFQITPPLITWTEVHTDPRWEQRTYSDIVSYNYTTGVKKTLTRRQKLFQPSPSNNSAGITCVELMPDGHCHLVVLDTLGLVKHSFPMPEGYVATNPVFDAADTSLTVVLRGGGYAKIVRYPLSDGDAHDLTEPVAGIISNLVNQNDTVYFSSDISGRDNIYALDPVTHGVFQLTHHDLGIQQFNLEGDKILYNVQTGSGLRIRSMSISGCHMLPVKYFESNPHQEAIPVANHSSTPAWVSRPASLLNNPFRVYSWALRPDEGGNVFRVTGRNVLHTLQGSVAYKFLEEDNAHTLEGSAALGLAYPLLTLTGGRTWGRRISSLSVTGMDSIRWNESNLSLGATLPLQFYRNNQIIQVRPLVQYGVYLPDYRTGDRVNYQSTQYMRAGIRLLNYRRRAYQQPASRFSQEVSINWYRAINHRADAFDLNTTWHFPGLGRNQVVEAEWDYHHQPRTDPYRFSNALRFISGYESFTSDRASRWRIAYHFPLFYPDAGINGIYFLKRLRGRVFYEGMQSVIRRTRGDLRINYSSSGAELLLDGQALNVLPVSFGIRFSYLWDRDLVRGSDRPHWAFIVEQLF